MDKLIRNGRVAIIYSPAFGAGWSSWSQGDVSMIFDRELAEAVERKDVPAMMAIAAAKWPDAYRGGLEDCELEWVDVGCQFRITEYDGNESVETRDGTDWTVA